MQKIISILATIILVLSDVAYADGPNIVKWVDSSDVTHYGDKLPAQEAGRNRSEINSQGIVVKQIIIGNKKNEGINQQKLEQERKEKILLASYTNPEEIDLARDRNLQLDQAALQALMQQNINVTSRTTRNNKAIKDLQARKKPLPPYLIGELKLAKTESANIDKQLAQLKLSMEATRKHYEEEKARFIALKYPDGAPSGTNADKVGAVPSNSSKPAATIPLAPTRNEVVTTTKTAPTKPK